ncbi:MAG: signal transduction histidine kinase [Solirubrobacterales bacterium]|nr:signal transduction histidine kinase [Solirubrobacterales bacterium]
MGHEQSRWSGTLASLFAASGESGRVAAGTDWSRTALGPIEDWPAVVSGAVAACMSSPVPGLLMVGRELVNVYNEAFRPILGAAKHPGAMGATMREVWPEVWDTIAPMLAGVQATGASTGASDLRLVLERNGFAEEAYFSFTYSPVWDVDGTVAAVHCAVYETTEQVLGERRLGTLRELADRTLEARTVGEVVEFATEAMGHNAADLPFVLTYVLSEDGGAADLVAAIGLREQGPGSPTPRALATQAEDEPLFRAVATGEVVRVRGIHERFPGLPEDVPDHCVILPLADPAEARATGAMVVGTSRRRPYDAAYASFLGLLADHVGKALVAARAHEAQRARAEALAELDRAKTEFFSNVSHELRTPLTLILGPVNEALADTREVLGPQQQARAALAARNAERLLKLVDALLDFTRVEAGGQQGSFEPTDLPRLTAELAGSFRAATERVGLALVLDTPPLGEEVLVDRELWETIVLNLLSNALKFTFEGSITVAVRRRDAMAELEVADTGIGIAQSELPRLFERFHRVQGARARSHEGAGIGLALVRDLVALHGGSVDVASEPGRGTRFTVHVPLGREHLPAAAVRPPGPRAGVSVPAEAHVDAVLPRRRTGELLRVVPADPGTRVLVVDDNADMREYVERLLAPLWAVETARDGAEALESALADPPDLVLTDVMMPRLDGFGLLRALRAAPGTRDVPIVVLSARAGVASSVEGLEAGADDYLVKPFAPRELIARIRVHLDLARSRAETAQALTVADDERRAREATARFRTLAETTSDLVAFSDVRGRTTYMNPAGRRLLGIAPEEDLSRMPWEDVLAPEAVDRHLDEVLPAAVACGTWRGETPLLRRDGTVIPTSQVVVSHEDEVGGLAFFATVVRDLTMEQEAARRVRAAEERLRHAFEDAPLGMAVLDGEPGGPRRVLRANPALARLTGRAPEALADLPLEALLHPEDLAPTLLALGRLLDGRHAAVTAEARVLCHAGGFVTTVLDASSTLAAHGRRELLLHVRDVTESKRYETRLQRLADRDPLTGLLNRRCFTEQLERELVASRRYGGGGAVLLLDLDDFKYVNDSLGHAAGDALIVATAEGFAGRLRESDTLARLGGDEFGVILPHADERIARDVAAALLATVRDGGRVSGSFGDRTVTASAGIALFSGSAAAPLTSDETLVQADIAMYDAKEAGRDGIAVFDPASDRQTVMELRLGWAERLREALADGRLVLHAQPIVGLQGDVRTRHELLVRMLGPDGELIPPAVFLEVAERFDLIQALDRWVVREAIELLAALQGAAEPPTLEVNLSGKSLLDPELPDWIAAELEARGVDGHGLVFEVTETAAVVNFDSAARFARRLAALGCGFALDDFGAGFCSFHYIKHLPFDFLKVDGEFVADLAHSPVNQLIVRAVVDIAHGLGKRTIAEFVDSKDTYELLQVLGVDYAQGFHVGAPVPVHEALGTPLVRPDPAVG